jgi:phosphopyruvate hydratase
MSALKLAEYLQAVYPKIATAETGKVRFLMNIYNGGLHALKEGEKLGQDKISVQEIMINLQTSTYREALARADQIYYQLGDIIGNWGYNANTFGDEGGYSPLGIGNDETAIDLVTQAINSLPFGPKITSISIDTAASSLYEKGKYKLGHNELDSLGMIAEYDRWIKQYPISSIEDGLAEDDWAGWQRFNGLLGSQLTLIGDDLLVTNVKRLKKAIQLKAANAILIKPNQIGTLSATMDAIKLAKENGWKWVVSHRSGETTDPIIADIAFATGAWGLKSGSPHQRPKMRPHQDVRRLKYLRMIELQEAKPSGEIPVVELDPKDIIAIDTQVINDSRRKPTIQARFVLDKKKSPWAKVPSGKSTGKGEAPIIEPKIAITKMPAILRVMKREKISNQRELDQMLMTKINDWGGNTTLAVSLAYAKALSSL